MGDAVTILIADDEETLVLGLRKSLVQEGYSVLTAADGEACLRQLATRHVDLVVLDVMMPGLDGMAVCRKVRETSGVPIIMMTGSVSYVGGAQGLCTPGDATEIQPSSGTARSTA